LSGLTRAKDVSERIKAKGRVFLGEVESEKTFLVIKIWQEKLQVSTY